LDTNGNGIIEEHELSEYLKHTQMPGILTGNTSPIERKSRELILKVCGNRLSHKGINVTDLHEFYIDRGMFTTDDIMFKYEVLDDWLFSEDLCDLYLKNEVPNIAPESAALKRGDSMARAASSPYLSRHRNSSFDSSSNSSSRQLMQGALPGVNTATKTVTSMMHPQASRPTTQQRSGDLTWRGRIGLPRSLSEADPKDSQSEGENRKTLDDSNVAYNPVNDSGCDRQPVQADMKQQQRALQVQEALLQHLLRTTALSYSRQTSEDNKNDDPNAFLSVAKTTCDVYIEKNQSIEDLSPMVLSTASSPRLGYTPKVDQQSQSFQQQQLTVQRMKQIMRQQQRDLEQLQGQGQGDQSSKSRCSEVPITPEEDEEDLYSNVSYKAHVDATIPASVSALTASTPVERDMDRERDKSRSPLSQRVVTESLSAFDTDLVRAVERLQGDVLERNNEIYRFQRLLQDKNLKIAEQGALIQGHERELKAKQEIVQSQQALIHTQQNMISRMQMLTIG
jgi:hypothetical protein